MGARTRACAHARLLRSPCSLGRSYRRKSAVCLLVSLVDTNRRSLALVSSVEFGCAFGGCRVFGFAGTRERPHAFSEGRKRFGAGFCGKIPDIPANQIVK